MVGNPIRRRPQRLTNGPLLANVPGQPTSSRPWYPRREHHCRTIAVGGLLLLAVALVFGQTVHFRFVNFDDDEYVCKNPLVSDGLSGEAVTWAFTHRHCANWHPLTWLSLMLDCQVYGPQRRGLPSDQCSVARRHGDPLVQGLGAHDGQLLA